MSKRVDCDPLVCDCLCVRRRTVVACAEAGQGLARIVEQTGATTGCGQCRPAVRRLVRRARWRRWWRRVWNRNDG